MTKRCYKCKEVKEKSEFHKDKSSKDGLRGVCKACNKAYREKNREAIREQNKAYKEKNREAIREQSKAYYEQNREAIGERKKAYREQNREAVLEMYKTYYKKNKVQCYARVTKRRAMKRNACPDWLTQEHNDQIKELYATAKQLTEETGIPHHVDHIIPLKGKSYDLGTRRMRHTVCGLHVPWNLEVVPAEENLSKNCKYSEWETEHDRD